MTELENLPPSTLVLIRSVRRANWEESSDLVTDSMFLDDNQRIIWDAIDGFYHDNPTESSDLSWEDIRRLVPATHKDYVLTLAAIAEHLDEGPLERRIVHQALQHSSVIRMNQVTTEWAVASAEKKKDKYDEVKKVVEQAVELEQKLLDDDRVEPLRASTAKQFATFVGPRIPFGFSPTLDAATQGGYPIGKLGGVMAPLSVGKTLTLCNLGAMALKAGFPVYHFSLEIDQGEVLAWYYSALTGVPYAELEGRAEEVFQLWKPEWGELLIYDYSGHRCTVGTVERAIQNIRRKDTRPGVMLLDYLALCDTPGGYADRYSGLGLAVRRLRKMMVKYELAGVTAIQANRQAMEAGRTELWHTADSIEIPRVVDWLMTLSQTPEEKNARQLHAKLARSRLGFGNPEVLLFPDYARLRVFEIGQHQVWEDEPDAQEGIA